MSEGSQGALEPWAPALCHPWPCSSSLVLGCRSLVLMDSALPCRKELKDPDQLYNTLKNLLAQIKVRGGCTLLCHPPCCSWEGAARCPRRGSVWAVGAGQGLMLQ